MKRLKPTSPGRRGMVVTDYSDLTHKEPEKNLTYFLHRKKGRSHGKITIRRRGGGVKKLYRTIDFHQNKLGEELTILSREYDPYRTAFIMLTRNQHGIKRYILAYEGGHVGEVIKVAEKAELKEGNRMYLKNIPVGTLVHNIELSSGRGGQLARSAGAYAKILAHDKGHTQLAMPSSEVRIVSSAGLATIGAVSNGSHREEVIGKAGRNRLMGKRPKVRGSAMNPVDHPHGGGEGRAPIGLKYPKTPWGKHALGVKTRKRKKYSSRLILKRRKTKR